nr:YrzQ family protein [Cytobacillus oceanisediminis]
MSRLKKILTSAMMLGAGMAAYNYAQKNNMISGRKMKRMQKKITKALF